VRDAVGVTFYRVRYEGPAALAMRVATELADADGVDLQSSDTPTTLAEGSVQLAVTVDGAPDDVLDAVGAVRGWLPPDASIQISSG
jgi:hypothetical protein